MHKKHLVTTTSVHNKKYLRRLKREFSSCDKKWLQKYSQLYLMVECWFQFGTRNEPRMATNTTSFKIFELFTGDPSEKIRHKKRKKYICKYWKRKNTLSL